jgi:hypothetical protein
VYLLEDSRFRFGYKKIRVCPRHRWEDNIKVDLSEIGCGLNRSVKKRLAASRMAGIFSTLVFSTAEVHQASFVGIRGYFLGEIWLDMMLTTHIW